MIVTQQPSTSTTKLEEEIVSVIAVFQNIARQRFEARACTARQGHCLLAKCAGDLVTAKKERLFLARSMWNHVIFCVRSHNQYLFIYIIS